MLPFTQVDVFGASPLRGNPVAVVHGADGLDGLDDESLQAFARWTGLSETTFLLTPTDARADYRLRIFTPSQELPFAGHPTLGSAHAWLGAGGEPRAPGRLAQECGAGIVDVRVVEDAAPEQDTGSDPAAGRLLAFRAPAFLRDGPVDDAELNAVTDVLGLDPGRLLRAEWIDNGPGWLGLQVDSAATVLALTPRFADLTVDVGVIGAHAADEAERLGAGYEVRAFCPGVSVNEDPVTGSLNAGFGVWLTRDGTLPASYVARQGTVLGADGRVQVEVDDAGEVWVAGDCATVLSGTVSLP